MFGVGHINHGVLRFSDNWLICRGPHIWAALSLYSNATRTSCPCIANRFLNLTCTTCLLILYALAPGWPRDPRRRTCDGSKCIRLWLAATEMFCFQRMWCLLLVSVLRWFCAQAEKCIHFVHNTHFQPAWSYTTLYSGSELALYLLFSALARPFDVVSFFFFSLSGADS